VFANCEIPDELKDISKGAVNVLVLLHEYVQTKNIDFNMTLSMFDANNSGAISLEEFYDVLNEILADKEVSLDDKKAFFEFVDKNDNGLIELDEF
jgi:Ca2+-binding EF-hand superfamily protein